MPDPNRATIKEIAEALSISKSQAERKASGGNWPYDEEAIRGGRRRLYPLATLPGDIYAALVVHRSGVRLPSAAEIDPEYRPTALELYQREVQGLDPSRQRRMDARLEILAAYDSFIDGREIRRNDSLIRFSDLYNRGQIPVAPWIRDELSHICRGSLINWDKERKGGKLRALAGRYGGRKDTSIFDLHEKLRATVIGFITEKPSAKISAAYAAAKALVGMVLDVVDPKTGVVSQRPLPHKRSFERFIENYKANNKALFSKATNPDEYRNKYEYAAGEMYKDIIRRNQLWEIDASPADVMCTDGRYSIYVCLDIHSRWPRVRVTKTPKAAVALLLVRECIVGWPGRSETAWGVPDELSTDNGSDFTANHFKDTLRRLGINQHICNPYSPKEKAAVERMIGTIQQQFMELQPGFVGHNVTDRRLIEARKAFAQRLGQDDKDAFCVELTADELQQRLNDWVEKVYVHTPHEGLGGKTPFEVRTAYRGRLARIEGDGALEMLLAAPADGDGTRTVTKKGVQVSRIDYYHGALMPGESVHVRLDPDDLGKIYVYRGEPWEFVGIAINPEREGVSRVAVAAEVKARQKDALADGMKEIRKAQRSIDMKSVSLEVNAAGEARNGSLAAFPVKADSHSTPDIAAAVRASNAKRGKPPKESPITPAEQARMDALAAELAAPKATVVTMSPKASQFKRALGIEDRIKLGAPVDDKERTWLADFQQSSTYLSMQIIAKDFGIEHALASAM
jgi:putative transposase